MSPGFGTLDVFPSIWGHWAGGPGDSVEDVKWLDDHLRHFFSNGLNGTESLEGTMKQIVIEDR